MIPAGFSGRVEVRDVSFRYPTRPSHQALADVSLTLEPGRLVALVGLSGSGKVRAALHIAHTYARMCTLVRLTHVGTHKRAHVYIKRRMRRPAWCNVCVCVTVQTTLVALLQRLYDPTSGSIWIDNQELKTIDAQWYRDHIGVVNQVSV